MNNNFETLLLGLALENSKTNPDPKKQLQYDKLLLPLEVHYMQELSHEKPGKLLDYGGAYGTQSVAFARLGHKVKMMDNMPELSNQEWLKAQGVSFQKHNIETDDLPENSSDYIILSEVLEHLNYSPVKAVQRLYKALKPGGKIFVSTPMLELATHREACTGRYCQYLHYRDIPEAWNGYEFIDAHHKLYSRNELQQLFHEVGFRVLECFPVYRGKHHYLVAQKPS